LSSSNNNSQTISTSDFSVCTGGEDISFNISGNSSSSQQQLAKHNNERLQCVHGGRGHQLR
jgi:hypothetical protein